VRTRLLSPRAARRVAGLSRWVLMLLLLAFALFPVFWMVSLSFRPVREFFTWPPLFLPGEPTLTNYRDAFAGTGVLPAALNSALVAGITTFLTLLVGLPPAYAVARLSFRGRSQFTSCLLVSQMFPPVLIVIPLAVVMKRVALSDTLASLVLTYTAFAIPYTVWILSGYIRTVPREIEEAALVDGCTVLDVIWRVLIPVIKPALVAIGMYTFLVSWDEFIFALTFIHSEGRQTLPLIIAVLFGRYDAEWGMLMAVSVVYTIPALLGFASVQRFLVRGLTMGAIR
jgi:ABC-type glycerol-3-phosphate transport system permease component